MEKNQPQSIRDLMEALRASVVRHLTIANPTSGEVTLQFDKESGKLIVTHCSGEVGQEGEVGAVQAPASY